MKYPIKGFNPHTFIDWEGKLACVIYLPGCNFRCGFCHSSSLVLRPQLYPNIPFEHIKKFLKEKKDWIDAVIIGGGEPTLYNGLTSLLMEIKRFSVLIKLDTNGTNPNLFKDLIEQKLVDYIAMDIKAPLEKEKYSQVVNSQVDIDLIKESIRILMSSGVDYEFRTTIVPSLLEIKDILAIAKYISGAEKYVLQQFDPKDTLDENMSTLKPWLPEELQRISKLLKEFVKDSFVRGV